MSLPTAELELVLDELEELLPDDIFGDTPMPIPISDGSKAKEANSSCSSIEPPPVPGDCYLSSVIVDPDESSLRSTAS